jgi:hypothetical protein
MDWSSIILVIVGLCAFEIISSIDNAVVNADVLATMSKKSRQWFLVWGIFIGVFLVRGLLPWAIVWMANPSLGLIGSFTAAFSNDPHIIDSVEKSAPLLLMAGGVFLVFLFFHWLFLEEKEYGLKGERFFKYHGVWFFAVVSILLSALTWYSLKLNPMIAFSATIGSSAFFIVYGFREQAEKAEKALTQNKGLTDLSKLIYLEVLDATFSIDGVVGAFAFTMSVPLILIGNGIGAIVVREFTIRGVDTIKKYKFLKNGAMYSILFLGILMVSKSFGVEVPEYASPLVTFGAIGYFLAKSIRHNRKAALN